MKQTFEEFCQELDKLAAYEWEYFATTSMVTQSGPESWLEYYNNGYSAREAWRDSCSYGKE